MASVYKRKSRTGKGWTWRAVVRQKGHLPICKSFNWIQENPCVRLKKLKEDAGRSRTLSKEEVTALLDAAKKSRSPFLYCIILMGLTTGARRGEILSLTWDNLNLKQGIAHIPETKNGSARTLPLSKSLQ